MKKKIIIEGMKCNNCANHVKEALENVKHVTNVEINLSDKEAIIDLSKEVKDKHIEKAVNKGKYKVVTIEDIA